LIGATPTTFLTCVDHADMPTGLRCSLQVLIALAVALAYQRV
jgi:hypothetical protein